VFVLIRMVRFMEFPSLVKAGNIFNIVKSNPIMT
jgi:hypothetical protein